MAEDVVTYESCDQVALVTFNRPDKLNAFNPAVEAAMGEAWRRFNAGDDRVAVLTGAGDKAFSAGADLEEGGELWPWVPGVGVEVAKPVICAVNGLTVGGAVVLVQMADLAIAAEDAWFSYPEARIGFTGGLIASLAARIPHKAAMEMILLGERMSAERARDVGLVNKVVPGPELMDATMDWASRIAGNAPLVLETLKAFVGRTVPKGPTEAAGYARHMTERTFESADLQEGIAAFRDKRNPGFEGR